MFVSGCVQATDVVVLQCPGPYDPERAVHALTDEERLDIVLIRIARLVAGPYGAEAIPGCGIGYAVIIVVAILGSSANYQVAAVISCLTAIDREIAEDDVRNLVSFRLVGTIADVRQRIACTVPAGR